MFDALAQWNRMLAASASMRTTGIRAAETFDGANKIVAARAAIIGKAIGSPRTADYGELGRMAPEKVDTLSRAGAAAATVWWDHQTAWMKHFQHLGTMTMRGRLPTVAEIGDLGERSTALMLQSIEATARLGAALGGEAIGSKGARGVAALTAASSILPRPRTKEGKMMTIDKNRGDKSAGDGSLPQANLEDRDNVSTVRPADYPKSDRDD